MFILSAKYGLISPQTLIPYYNDKLKTAYTGAYPQGDGFFLGGVLYFKNAPPAFKPLIAGNPPIGEMVKATQLLLIDPGLRSGTGVTATLYTALRSGKYTKTELRALLWQKFPDGHPRMDSTVDIQLRQQRIGDERNCWLRREGDYFWLEPK